MTIEKNMIAGLVAGFLRTRADRLEAGFVKEFDYKWDGNKLEVSETILPGHPPKHILITCSIDAAAQESDCPPIRPNPDEDGK